MKFIGIDLGWEGKPTGLALLVEEAERLILVKHDRLVETSEILAWIDGRCGSDDAMVAVDAPLIIRNATGMRPAEKQCQERYASRHAGSYPSNLGRPFARQTTAFAAELAQRGFRHGVNITPRCPGRYQLEVFPHPAAIELFALDQIIKYKKGDVDERRAGLIRYRAMLVEKLGVLEPALKPDNLPVIPHDGTALKDLEDRLDAVLCAYIGAYCWHWGMSRNRVLGDDENGYIVVPLAQPAACQPSACAAGMPDRNVIAAVYRSPRTPNGQLRHP
jgi:predicted RNase H-like nuclease